ncbi:Gfo/Idh/MocA family protein [Paenibacillus oceani]|uniref:Gfo/Idh/MocA family protein n=1 Tax=Paenibacillus oceani TaxID=2772510 RepID=UPI00295B9C7D|nr:Gfo/Idh/MocA family oxidoreductase [Paenibacillus oceani]
MAEIGNRRVKLGIVGLGVRGRGLLDTLLAMEDVDVPALCDLNDDKLQLGLDQVEAAGRAKAESYKDYNELLGREDIEGVIISTSWTSHFEIAIASMRAGKYAGSEVGAVASLEECWELVRTSEQTGVPCMLLENCNYGRDELAVLNMVKKGLFGELIHCQCGYEHDLRKGLAMDIDKRHYRVHHYLKRNGDNYPTHGLGPAAKCLNINRGNQFLTLTSMSSKARGLREWAVDNLGGDHPMTRVDVAQGDIVNTIIKCAGGETILLTLDTTLPRPYSRAGRVQGTKGIWMEDNNSIHIEGRSPEHAWESFDSYREEYEHPLWKQFLDMGVRGGHGGMDYLCLRAFIDSIAKQIATPIDVYDTAAWTAVSILSEQSVSMGGQPVPFPDFTKGKWISREPGPANPYSLE